MGRKSLLLGETNSGKTHFTFHFLCHILERKNCEPTDISVLDFAPPRIKRQNSAIAGTLGEFFRESNNLSASQANLLNSVHWLERDSSAPGIHTFPKILAPRFFARSAQDVLKACCVNFIITEKQLSYYLLHPTKVLIVNDVGIYLHLGGLRLLTKVLALPQTSLLNAYFGTTLLEDQGSYISRREGIMLSLLAKSLDTYLCADFLPNT
ncbi:MAG: hypothetical protein RBG13Loki_0596 [Promethearchaeota archaeon CR_4]|nr:MAG: hypothetical protein RBG13Loki_0596 [Candidatus Lokiarchaeota archaeon CR_4]